ncbi:MAG: hypothetical protein WC707_02350 [Candidatus Babeliaceae bacterium]|jgi:hypothetical protein
MKKILILATVIAICCTQKNHSMNLETKEDAINFVLSNNPALTDQSTMVTDEELIATLRVMELKNMRAIAQDASLLSSYFDNQTVSLFKSRDDNGNSILHLALQCENVLGVAKIGQILRNGWARAPERYKKLVRESIVRLIQAKNKQNDMFSSPEIVKEYESAIRKV